MMFNFDPGTQSSRNSVTGISPSSINSDSMNNYGSTAPNGRNSSVVGRFGEEYDELLGGSVPCPSCMGAGRIPKERESEMVALIPLNDKRLKPRRTALYVCLAVGICVLIAGLIAFFLFPRSVNLQSNMPLLHPTYVYIEDTKNSSFVNLTVINEFNVTNSNFFSVDVTEMEVSCSFDTRVIGSAKNDTLLTVPLRSQRAYQMELNVTFSGDEGYIAKYCNSRFAHTLLLPFQASASVTSMGRTEISVLTTYQHVKCNKQ